MTLAVLAALALVAGPVAKPAPSPSAGQPARAAPPPPALPALALPPPASPAPAPPQAAGRALRLAMPEVKVVGDLPPRQVQAFEQALLAEVRKLAGLSVIGMAEIRDMLSFEHQRQMMGCKADEGCLAEIGGALGVDELLAVSLIVDDGVTLSAKRLGLRSAGVAGSQQRRLRRADGEELLAAVGPVVQGLFPERSLRPGRIRGIEPQLALRLHPPPLPRWVFGATAGAAVAAAAGGITMGLLARDSKEQYDALVRRSATEPVPGGQLVALQRDMDSRGRAATVLLVGAGALGVAAGVEAFFTDWHGYRAGVSADRGGVSATLSGSF